MGNDKCIIASTIKHWGDVDDRCFGGLSKVILGNLAHAQGSQIVIGSDEKTQSTRGGGSKSKTGRNFEGTEGTGQVVGENPHMEGLAFNTSNFLNGHEVLPKVIGLSRELDMSTSFAS